jgi:hypothetical protein
MRKVDARPNRVDLSARLPLEKWRHAFVLELDGRTLRVGVSGGERHSRERGPAGDLSRFMRPRGRHRSAAW